ncbi:hypothetical protein O181_024384 [Austropuccinia psidii MF-1]|uniref:Uncharacterized protein n=1 Tax=Austropuccinia psidii MF-1 TaxID=1389203 RepID=A0A9Q3CIK0_9BASI|nr:hypothetical protein [Austropuccinia psidii MF-1]
MSLRDGFTVLKAQNTEGRQVYLQVLPIHGDLLAIHKAVGFGPPAALKFCGWCDANLNELQLMKVGTKRTGYEIREVEKAWRNEKSLKEQEDIQKETGIQWSELNMLPY